MLRLAALAWWQCASRILCHHVNAARRSPQLSSTLARALRHRGLTTVVSAHCRTVRFALLGLLRATPRAPSVGKHQPTQLSRSPRTRRTSIRSGSGHCDLVAPAAPRAWPFPQSRGLPPPAVCCNPRSCLPAPVASQPELPRNRLVRTVVHRGGPKLSRRVRSLHGQVGVQTVHEQPLAHRRSIAQGRCPRPLWRRLAK